MSFSAEVAVEAETSMLSKSWEQWLKSNVLNKKTISPPHSYSQGLEHFTERVQRIQDTEDREDCHEMLPSRYNTTELFCNLAICSHTTSVAH